MIKTVTAKIFNSESDEFLSDINLTIELSVPTDPDKEPQFIVKGIINKFSTEFDKINLLLEITPSLRGYAQFSISQIAGWFTEYNINLRDSTWRNTDWFEKL